MTQKTADDEAALYDAVVVPRYSSRFGQLIVDAIPRGVRAQVLDFGCGTGYPAFALLDRLDASGRVIAIDPDAGLVDLARRRAMALSGGRIFFKVESAERLSFGDEVFDYAVGNVVLHELEHPDVALNEVRRVLVREGTLVATRPLEGTFQEILDMFREISLKRDSAPVAARTEELARRYPTPQAFARQLENAGFDDVEVREHIFRLSFRNAADIVGDPLVRFIGLSEWRWVAGFEHGGDTLLGEVEKSLDTYFAGGPLSLTVRAGVATGRK